MFPLCSSLDVFHCAFPFFASDGAIRRTLDLYHALSEIVGKSTLQKLPLVVLQLLSQQSVGFCSTD